MTEKPTESPAETPSETASATPADSPAAAPEAAHEEPLLIPSEFHPNRFKLFLGAGALSFVSLFVGSTWMQNGAQGGLTPILCLIVLGIAWALAREAKDPRPVLIVTPEGLEDRRHGFIPWSDVALYEAKNSILAKYFGYSVRKGAQLQRNGWLYQAQGMMNLLGGRPRRIWMKHMLPLGVELMALSCRRYAPEKEKQG